jgi:cellulose synthase/poly-beta-1,6-N-acetylglucosamine synthase-like glycosyltransferase
MMLFFYFLLSLAILYAAFILWCWLGLSKTKNHTDRKVSGNTFVSVIIPARNEESDIERTLSDLASQDYPASLFEIIVIDDNSTDRTTGIVSDFIKAHQTSFSIRLIEMNKEGRAFKKGAITKGVRMANGKLLITTDADCIRTAHWLTCIVSYYEQYSSEMICAPVAFHSEENFFQRMQGLEFCGLIAIAAGSIAMKKPMLCNGANLAFTKSIFEKVNGICVRCKLCNRR